jgi:hypothetical protein
MSDLASRIDYSDKYKDLMFEYRCGTGQAGDGGGGCGGGGGGGLVQTLPPSPFFETGPPYRSCTPPSHTRPTPVGHSPAGPMHGLYSNAADAKAGSIAGAVVAAR